MRIRYRKEDEADKWLKENDPYYSSTAKNKMRTTDHPYETVEQEHRRVAVEIPFSNLNASQRRQMKDVAGAYDEDGNFEL